MAFTLRPNRIAIIVNNVEGYARGVLRGVTSYAFARAWECQVMGVNLSDPLEPPGPITGMIVQAWTGESMTRLREAKVPVVNVSSALPLTDVSSVVCDDRSVGRLGAEHFLRRGFRQFLFFMPIDRQFAKMRHEGFAARLAEAAIQPIIANDRASLARALFESSKPLAVMCCNDAAALTVLEQCRVDHIRVPDDAAVLGVDNDDLMQSLAFPPLSSVNTASERIGFEAASMLEKLISKKHVRDRHLLIPPVGIITRQSSDLVAVADRDVSETIRFIRDHAGSPIGVDDVLRSVTVSRRQLERRFRAALGHSLLEEIRRCRIDRARQLLVETDLTLPQIALASGFSTASYLSVVFQKETGIPPGAFRKNHRRE